MTVVSTDYGRPMKALIKEILNDWAEGVRQTPFSHNKKIGFGV